MTLNKNINKEIVPQVIPYTFKRDKLNKKKVSELDVFFQTIAQEIQEEQELKTLNYG